MLKSENLIKNYGDLAVLKGVSLEIAQGEVVSIVGSSGAGKTTLLQLLGTLEKPDQGTITLDGVDPFSLSPKKLAEFRNSSIGFIFQFHQLFLELPLINL
jgi:lipoprotein-releasing system ATP-binding protein